MKEEMENVDAFAFIQAINLVQCEKEEERKLKK